MGGALTESPALRTTSLGTGEGSFHSLSDRALNKTIELWVLLGGLSCHRQLCHTHPALKIGADRKKLGPVGDLIR